MVTCFAINVGSFIKQWLIEYVLDISSENVVPTEFADDLRVLNIDSKLFAVSLEDKQWLSIFKYVVSDDQII